MPLPAIAAGAIGVGAAALPHMAKIPKYLKAFFASKKFLPALGYGALGVGMLGGALGQAGERGLTREQLRIQTLIQKASAEATKMTVKESRANTKKYIAALMKAKREERRETRDIMAMQTFQQSQDRQMALVLQAVQALSRRPMGASTQAPGAGMVGLMRGSF